MVEGIEQEKTATTEYLEEIKAMFAEFYTILGDQFQASEDRKEEIRELAHQRELKHTTNFKKNALDKEKFILAAGKREYLEHVKSQKIKQKFDEKVAKDREGNLKSTLGTISTLQGENNQTLFNIGRAAALAMAYIDGSAAVTKALASAPPPFNFVLAGAVGAAVAVQVGKIISAKPPAMNDGGMIMGAPGIDQNLAMLSRGELVVPTRNFDEVVGSVGGSRDADIFGGESQTGIVIGFDSEEAGQFLTAQQIENQALGISIEEVS